MIWVVDASVAVKWFLRIRPEEPDTDQALRLLSGFAAGSWRFLQPSHFVAEVAAVLAREKPADAAADLADLLDIGFETIEHPAIYASAVDISIRIGHHLFDTLYHATALHTPGASLITADQRYFEKAKDLGQITSLAATRLT